MLFRVAVFLVVLSSIFLQNASAQDSTNVPTLPYVYVDCDFCDQTYLRRELDFLNHVRDQSDADIYILITSQRTASGGRSYKLEYSGQEKFTGLDQSLEHISQQSDTDDQRRAGLAQVIKMGLMPYLSQTAQFSQFDIGYRNGGVERVGLGQDDPWNSWVFNVDLGGNIDLEESQNELGFDGQFEASRITEALKFEFDLDVEVEREKFESRGVNITNSQNEIDSDVELIKSINNHWSWGAFAGFRSATFSNTKSRWDFNPAIEYNVYPWSESDRRVIAIAYFMGFRHNEYYETTIFDKDAESLLAHSIRLQVEFEQPWGETFVRLSGFQYLHDLSKNRLELFGFLDIRLTKGLSLFFRGSAELIHDQLSLPRGDASLEEVLLRQRQLATDFELGASMGLRITFGSIYNNVVNQRL